MPELGDLKGRIDTAPPRGHRVRLGPDHAIDVEPTAKDRAALAKLILCSFGHALDSPSHARRDLVVLSANSDVAKAQRPEDHCFGNRPLLPLLNRSRSPSFAL